MRRIYVSEDGSDTNTGARSSPLRTFGAAISVVDDGGWIVCLESGEYGSLTIDRSVTIDASLGGVVSVASGNAVNITADQTKIVRFLGVAIEGIGGQGAIGINAIGGASVYADNLSIRGFGSGSALGINFAPPPGSFGQMHLLRPFISECGNNDVSGGILVKPNYTGRALVTLEAPRLVGNSIGLIADGDGMMGTLKLDVCVRGGAISGNSLYGVVSRARTDTGSTSAVTVIMLDGTHLFGNGTLTNGGAGALMEGSIAFINMVRCIVNRNPSGVSRIISGYWGTNSTNMVAGNTQDSVHANDFTGDLTGQTWNFGVQ